MERPDMPVVATDEQTLSLESGRQYSSAQLFFLRRLAWLIQTAKSGPVAEAWQGRLLAKALYSTYMDCRLLNVDREARALLAREQTTV